MSRMVNEFKANSRPSRAISVTHLPSLWLTGVPTLGPGDSLAAQGHSLYAQAAQYG